jgi:hypothetical protein
MLQYFSQDNPLGFGCLQSPDLRKLVSQTCLLMLQAVAAAWDERFEKSTPVL